MSSSKLQVETELLAKGINPTAMRILVLEYLKSQREAVTLSDIESSFEQSDRVTLYRTLKTFEQKGVIHRITTGAGAQYALCDAQCSEDNHRDTHLHFICNRCKKTTCLTQVLIPKMIIPKGFHIDQYEVLARGICELCSDSAAD
ncbi:Fur family transcriptional regulator [Flavobacterium sp. JP2137]|uniref:Fur family transcriptional regulator n=1 Tax=Flavobacterium sp. JP2137 TaxID=3414510 RepID=UPI003D2FBED0